MCKKEVQKGHGERKRLKGERRVGAGKDLRSTCVIEGGRVMCIARHYYIPLNHIWAYTTREEQKC